MFPILCDACAMTVVIFLPAKDYCIQIYSPRCSPLPIVGPFWLAVSRKSTPGGASCWWHASRRVLKKHFWHTSIDFLWVANPNHLSGGLLWPANCAWSTLQGIPWDKWTKKSNNCSITPTSSPWWNAIHVQQLPLKQVPSHCHSLVCSLHQMANIMQFPTQWV